MHRTAASVVASLLTTVGTSVAQADSAPSIGGNEPRTRAESSVFTETSSLDDVQRFVDACVRLPRGDRLTIEVAGRSEQERPLVVVRIVEPEPRQPRLRALVIGSIHAGEVEGKEALQQLVREFASGEHTELLRDCELWFLPVYNVDGNEATGPKNRVGQNGPDITGERANAKGLDLNRDFVKAEAAETCTLQRLWRELDPHLFVDLHTTNGSHHGYHLTYAPSLSPNVDREVALLSRALLDDATAALAKDGLQSFDYGNFESRPPVGDGAPTRGWYTYDHRARYGVNCFGLRNRVAILSEAYSYADFATRVRATRAFVLALLHGLVRRADEVRQVAEAADRRACAADAPVWFGFDTVPAAAESWPVLVGTVERVEQGNDRPHRFVRQAGATAERMPVVRAFRARQQRALPTAWLITAPSAAVMRTLRQHGIEFTSLDEARRMRASRFTVSQKRKPKRPFQGHQELVLVGTWSAADNIDLPPGTLVVPAQQRLARLAATLLEPESEDSLSTWNFFEAETGDSYPVLRLVAGS